MIDKSKDNSGAYVMILMQKYLQANYMKLQDQSHTNMKGMLDIHWVIGYCQQRPVVMDAMMLGVGASNIERTIRSMSMIFLDRAVLILASFFCMYLAVLSKMVNLHGVLCLGCGPRP